MAPMYDIIIVRGGTSGCVLAARLTEDPKLRTLVLEAGKDHGEHQIVSSFSGSKSRGDETLNWNYKTISQDSYADQKVLHPRGKGLGGSSLIHHGVMAFPDKHSIDNLALLGNKGWRFKELRPHYQKFHTLHDSGNGVKEKLDINYHGLGVIGTSGPTLANMGRIVKDDPQNGDAVGGLHAAACLDPNTWTRSHAAESYLTHEVRARPNLHIIVEALVEKILFNESALAKDSSVGIKGVQYVAKGGTTHIIGASREVILCGGAFNSPQILELSGIGPKNVLDKFEIGIKVDLPGVGANLQDHPISGASFESRTPALNAMSAPAEAGAVFGEYRKHKTGLMANGTWNLAYLNPQCAEAERKEFSKMLDDNAPDPKKCLGQAKQYRLLRRAAEDPDRRSSWYLRTDVQPDGLENQFPKPEGAEKANFLSIWTSVSPQFSRGTCHISSTNVRDAPIIDPRYMTHPADVEIAARLLQSACNVADTEPQASLLKSDGLTIPGDLREMVKDLDKVKQHVRRGVSCYDPCGACSMMLREDDGVVDTHLRVYGVQGLRVVDASILPIMPRGNIQTTVYAVAVRAADIIKKDLANK